jgi:O-antigen/teichoic acid export membrane protein
MYAGQSKYYHDSEDKEQRGRVIFTINSLVFGLLLITILSVYIFGFDHIIFSFLLKPEVNYAKYKYPLLFTIVVSVLYFMLNNFFLTSEKITKVQIYNILRLFLLNGVVILLLNILHIDTVFLRLSANFLIETILYSFFVIYLIREMRFKFDFRIAKKSFILGLPLVINGIIGILVNFGDKYFLQRFGTLVDLSLYYLAFSFASIIQFLYATFQNIWLPLLLKEKDINKCISLSKKVSGKLLMGFIGISLLIIIGVYFLLLLKIIPDKYYEVLKILPILLIAQIFVVFTSFVGNFLIYLGKTSYIVYIGLIVGGVSIFFNVILIPRYHIYGAATVSLFINLLYFISYFMYIKHNLKVQSISYKNA